MLDEQIASQVVPGPGPAGDEGVGIAGVNTAGGKVGLGGGGTGVGTGAGGAGTGSGGGGGSRRRGWRRGGPASRTTCVRVLRGA